MVAAEAGPRGPHGLWVRPIEHDIFGNPATTIKSHHVDVCPDCGLLQAFVKDPGIFHSKVIATQSADTPEPDRLYTAAEFDELMKRGAESVPTLIQILATPAPLWSGSSYARVSGPPHFFAEHQFMRRMAAAGLGQLKAPQAVRPLLAMLEDSDVELRLEAIWALGEIRDARAVDALLPLLAVNDAVEDRTVSQVATDALRALGQHELAEAFIGALRGEPTCLENLRRMMSPMVVSALVRVLDCPEQSSAVSAAITLGELGAMEALPHLQARADRYRRPDMPVEEACARALARFKALEHLPRAADTSPNVRDLPRVAGDVSVEVDRLPRVPGE